MNKIWMNALRAAAAGGAAFSPADISGLVFDHDCDLIAGNDGDSISSATFNSVAFSQAAGAKQPTLKKAANGINGHGVLRFSGAQAWRTTSTLDLSSHDDLTVFVVAKFSGAAASSRILVELTSGITNNGALSVNFDTGDKINYALKQATGYSIVTSLYGTVGRAVAYSALFDMSLSTREAYGNVNGLNVMTQGLNSNNSGGNFANDVLYIGARAESSLYITADIARIILYSRALNATEWRQVNTFLRSTYALDDTGEVYQFADNAYPMLAFDSNKNPYIRTSAGARVVYTTDATSVDIDTWNDIYTLFPDETSIGVRIDGADYSTVLPGAAGDQTDTLALGAGTKTVEFINGMQSSPGFGPPANVAGTFIKNLTFNSSATLVAQPASPRLLVYGDSISVGAFADSPPLEGVWQLVRNAYGGSLVIEGWGWRSLYDDCATAIKRAEFVAHIAAMLPASIWLAIGTNDYGLNKWSAASFGAAYAALLDDLHTSLPNAVIYCQSPLDRGTETANGSGSTLGDYRTQISTAAAARSGYCTFVDGTGAAYPGTAEMVDGIHPSTAGHAMYAAAVISELGL